MSDQYLTKDVLSVIALCADVRTAHSIRRTCHGIALPALSHWLTVVEDSEMHSNDTLVSSRSVLRADHPIPHGESTITYGGTRKMSIMYDRGAVMHVTQGEIVRLGSRCAHLYNSSAMILGEDGLCAIELNDDGATVISANNGVVVKFPSKPDGDSELDILRWYARVMPDTRPATSVLEALRLGLFPIPRWVPVSAPGRFF